MASFGGQQCPGEERVTLQLQQWEIKALPFSTLYILFLLSDSWDERRLVFAILALVRFVGGPSQGVRWNLSCLASQIWSPDSWVHQGPEMLLFYAK